MADPTQNFEGGGVTYPNEAEIGLQEVRIIFEFMCLFSRQTKEIL